MVWLWHWLFNANLIWSKYKYYKLVLLSNYAFNVAFPNPWIT